MAGIDLHAHTDRSDGTFTPTELVRLALDRGLDVVAVTDHDTTDGLDEAAAAADGSPIEVVPGVEFSAIYEGASVHVLCYWMDPQDLALQEELQRLRDDRFRRGEKMVEKLQALGHPISFDRVREISGGRNIVRPHIAQALVEAGVVPTEEDAFTEELIADGGKADVAKHALHPLDALALIRQARGVCVLAHPGMWAGQQSVPVELIEAMAGGGMAGLEADHPDHTPELRERYRNLAADLGLVATGASDCHGTRYDPVRLGSVTTDPLQFARLKDRAGRAATA
jgi:3',5'-nucleoside bisphosphate phosphatase